MVVTCIGNEAQGSQAAKFNRMAKVSSGFLRQMSEDKLLIPSSSIKLLECVGQGKCKVCCVCVDISI